MWTASKLYKLKLATTDCMSPILIPTFCLNNVNHRLCFADKSALDIEEQHVCVPVCRWNQLDLVIVLLSIMGITLEKIEEASLPINPTIIRIMRVLRIARGTNDSLRCFRKVPLCRFITQVWQITAGDGGHPPDGAGRHAAVMRV